MNQEWTSAYDMLKTPIWYFIKVVVAFLSCTTICQQKQRTRLSFFQCEVWFERKPPTSSKLEASWSRLPANELSCADQVIQRYHKQCTRKRQNASYFRLDKVLNSPNKSSLVNDLINSEQCATAKLTCITFFFFVLISI